MTRDALIFLFLCSEALAHPGHREPSTHFHATPILVLAVLVAVCATFRAIKSFQLLRDSR